MEGITKGDELFSILAFEGMHDGQLHSAKVIRCAAIIMINAIADEVPCGPDSWEAVKKVREAYHYAIEGIRLDGRGWCGT